MSKLSKWFDRIVQRAIIDGLALHRSQTYKERPGVRHFDQATILQQVSAEVKIKVDKEVKGKKIPWENQNELYEAIKAENLKTTYGAMIQDFIDNGPPVSPSDWHKTSDFWKK